MSKSLAITLLFFYLALTAMCQNCYEADPDTPYTLNSSMFEIQYEVTPSENSTGNTTGNSTGNSTENSTITFVCTCPSGSDPEN